MTRGRHLGSLSTRNIALFQSSLITYNATKFVHAVNTASRNIAHRNKTIISETAGATSASSPIIAQNAMGHRGQYSNSISSNWCFVRKPHTPGLQNCRLFILWLICLHFMMFVRSYNIKISQNKHHLSFSDSEVCCQRRLFSKIQIICY